MTNARKRNPRSNDWPSAERGDQVNRQTKTLVALDVGGTPPVHQVVRGNLYALGAYHLQCSDTSPLLDRGVLDGYRI